MMTFIEKCDAEKGEEAKAEESLRKALEIAEAGD
jgi:hypothetical protein